MGSMTLHPAMEVQRLVDAGLLTKTMAYRVFPDATTFLSFSNRLPGRRLHAEISYDHSRPVGQLFGMCVTEEVDGEEPEVVSVYRHGCLEHLIQTAKGFLCYYASKSRPVVKRKSAVTFRVDDDLREAFDIAVEATGESRAVVLRQLLRFFVGKAPDPRVIG